MLFYEQINDFPDDNDWLSEDKQKTLLKIMNNCRYEMQRLVGMGAGDSEDFRRTDAYLNGMLTVCSAVGLRPVWGWVSHRNEYFFATKNDFEIMYDFEKEIELSSKGEELWD